MSWQDIREMRADVKNAIFTESRASAKITVISYFLWVESVGGFLIVMTNWRRACSYKYYGTFRKRL
jgi:hypothetical protein